MDPYLTACQTYYTGADGREYHVFTATTPSIEGRTDPVGYRSELIPAGGTVDFPATVMVEDAVTQDYAAEDFAALLDSWDVSVTAPEGVSRVKLWDAELEAENSTALLYRRLGLSPRRVYRRQRGGRAVRLRVQQLLYIYHQAHRLFEQHHGAGASVPAAELLCGAG